MTKKTQILFIRNIVWAIVIFILCTMPGESIPTPGWSFPHLDKVVHFGMFFIMSLLLCNELEYQTKWSKRTIYIVAFTCSTLYGGIIEILQDSFFNRSGDLWDFIADALGALAGCLTYPYVRKLKNRVFPSKSL